MVGRSIIPRKGARPDLVLPKRADGGGEAIGAAFVLTEAAHSEGAGGLVALCLMRWVVVCAVGPAATTSQAKPDEQAGMEA